VTLFRVVAFELKRTPAESERARLERSNRPIVTVRCEQIHPLPPPESLGYVARLQAARDEEDRVIVLFLGSISLVRRADGGEARGPKPCPRRNGRGKL
jgi:hypothetical protein